MVADEHLLKNTGENVFYSAALAQGLEVNVISGFETMPSNRLLLSFGYQDTALRGSFQKLTLSSKATGREFKFFLGNSKTKSALSTTLAGDSSTIVNKASITSQQNLHSQFLGLGRAFAAQTNNNSEALIIVGAEFTKSQIDVKTDINAGLINSNEEKKHKNLEASIFFRHNISLPLSESQEISVNFERTKSFLSKNWTTNRNRLGLGYSFKLQKLPPKNLSMSNTNRSSFKTIRTSFSDGTGFGSGTFNNDVEGFKGTTPYTATIPLTFKRASVGVFSHKQNLAYGIEFFNKKRISKLSTVPLNSILSSNDYYHSSLSADVNSLGISLRLEKYISSFAYGFVATDLSTLEYNVDETTTTKINTAKKKSHGEGGFAAVKLGIGRLVGLSSDLDIFIENEFSIFRGDWFGVDHDVMEVATTLGLRKKF